MNYRCVPPLIRKCVRPPVATTFRQEGVLWSNMVYNPNIE